MVYIIEGAIGRIIGLSIDPFLCIPAIIIGGKAQKFSTCLLEALLLYRAVWGAG